MLLAGFVALVHGALVVFMLIGALLAIRRPRLAYVHAPVGLAILGINLAGQDCPVTWVEQTLRAHAGVPRYTGGFLGHYAYQPLGLNAHSTATQLAIYTVALLPNAIGYGILASRSLGRVRARRALPEGASGSEG